MSEMMTFNRARGCTLPANFVAIPVERAGPFAIHPTLTSLGPSQFQWTLSHFESGCAVAAGLPSEAAARALIDRISPLADWSVKTHAEVSAWPEKLRKEIGQVIAGVRCEFEDFINDGDGE